MNEQKGKWRLHYGIHRGTITSRDEGEPTLHDTEQDARLAFAREKAEFAKTGHLIWFANLYTPEGKCIKLEDGASYER